MCGAGPGVWCRQDRPTPNRARLPIHEERKVAGGKYGAIGWHTFRHTYRSWLDETGAPNEGAAGTDTSCLDPDDDECLWAGYVVIEKRSE